MNNTIVFVDDDKSVLDGLRRMLRGYRKQWRIYFCLSAKEALEVFKEKHVDVIISDMRMPVMNGVQLLHKIRSMSPHTIRIALSGYVNKEMTLESIQVVHQFITKPCDKESISAVIERAISLPSTLCDEKVKAVLGKIDTLPSLPTVYTEMIKEVNSDNCSLLNIGKIVNKDVAVSTNLLKIVNSSFFGFARHVDSAAQAVSILGIETVENLVLFTSVFSSDRNNTSNFDELYRLNTFCLKVGLLAAKLADVTDLPDKQKGYCQIAGMMTGLGRLVLEEYSTELSDDARTETDYAQMSSYILGMWGLPLEVVDSVRWHQNPSESGLGSLAPLTVVHAAYAMIKSTEGGNELGLASEFLDIDYLLSVVHEDDLEKWLQVAIEFLTPSEGP